ncbi:hypothetical protein [Pseudophaeobacter flagellatus]|uniref:hypothetical protein n=1 Tax=Pseudophaeobacter flagellatus TaxID=2899119 RepID=UPI001E5EBDED|nr:hypothetical protein [Pseudophaeobacter flagellatus]MCD9149045.1 hypothetical protein [Pseudophaeobacter flagellatus]
MGDTGAGRDAVVRIGSAGVTLPSTRMFEDLALGLADLDGDGQHAISLVESDV